MCDGHSCLNVYGGRARHSAVIDTSRQRKVDKGVVRGVVRSAEPEYMDQEQDLTVTFQTEQSAKEELKNKSKDNNKITPSLA